MTGCFVWRFFGVCYLLCWMFWHSCQQSITSRVKMREKDGINSLPKTFYKISSKYKGQMAQQFRQSCKCPQESLWLNCPQDIWIAPTSCAQLALLTVQCLPCLLVFSSCWQSSDASYAFSVCFSLKRSSKLTVFCLQYNILNSTEECYCPFPEHFVLWLIN